ncbi:KAP family NTPase [Dyadobacter sp. LJ53]|uniref:KAP family P-loop NTPase fold protein n=1 Tax=Dyadobacter chenwenxiniae TaxID=2906456 RepID=UPI001F38241E|nr:P-loop NTPase fold protein [Dyadobacter chenwenxiniae]MCF0051638.1 KAP family NTPase [Dyadobacter chenwenxiniae]
MFIRHNDLVISKDDPFASCQLGRKKYADILTQIVDEPGNGFVLAINNEWGTGKTTFVKMWQQQLQNNGFTTLYFNAWENDFERNPLAAIMSELKVLRAKKNEEIYRSLLEKGAKLTKHILPAAAKALVKQYVNIDEIVDAVVSSTEAAAEILENEIDEYAARKKSLLDFRADLEKFLETTKGEKPVIFIIDELDRCRPNYAVEVLEHMKHFFAVNGIIFVLSIDKVQLGHAIRGVYGSEQLNADEYLRRFIDLEYSIPEPDTKQFVHYLFQYFAFDQFFKSNQRLRYSEASDEREAFLTFAVTLFEKGKPTLRQQEKMFAHARISLKSFSYGNYLFPSVFLFLIFLRILNNDLYQKVNKKEIKLQDLSDRFSQIFGIGDISEYKVRGFLYVQAQLLNMYNNYIFGHYAKHLVIRNNDGEVEALTVRSELDKSENNILFTEMIFALDSDSDKKSTSLEHLLLKIELLNPVIT